MLMKTDELGIPRFSNQDLLDMIYTGHIDKCHVVLCDPNDDIEKFNTHAKENGISPLKKYIPIDVDKTQFDKTLQSEWFMPEKYKQLNIEEKIINMCNGEQEVARAYEELRYMFYLVDFMRENKIVWGVGRGSSTASFVLYLIGIHKINPIQFQLDWREFLR
jgi:DNA polymerase III alpha subunit